MWRTNWLPGDAAEARKLQVFQDAFGFPPGTSPSRALHTRRLVAQAVVSVTEACSRSIAAHSSMSSFETGAAIAL